MHLGMYVEWVLGIAGACAVRHVAPFPWSFQHQSLCWCMVGFRVVSPSFCRLIGKFV